MNTTDTRDQKGIKQVNSVVSHQAHFHHQWHYSFYMWLFLALVNSSRAGLWQAWEGALDFITCFVTLDFITCFVTILLLNLTKSPSLCFPHLWKIIPVTQKLAGFDFVTLVKFLDIKPGQPLMLVYRKLLLQLVNTGLLCREMTRFTGPRHTACHSPTKNPPKQGNKDRTPPALWPDPGSFHC